MRAMRQRPPHLLLALFFATCLANAQHVIDPPIAVEHQLTHQAPVYPAIAQAAHVTGVVVLQLTISATGEVTAVKLVSGPPMLNGSAQEAAKHWTYKPFEVDGKPAEATTTIVVPFVLGKEDPIDLLVASAYFPLFNKCIRAVSTNTDPAEQDSDCKMAAAEADKFPSDSRFIERRSAYVYYALALLRDHQAADAVTIADKAVAVVQQGHDDGSGSSAAYGMRGQARGSAGDLKGADADLTIAEDFERKALATPAGKDLHSEYTRTLKNMLMFHARVLATLGDSAAAATKTAEADKL
jgi:TonB family protein